MILEPYFIHAITVLIRDDDWKLMKIQIIQSRTHNSPNNPDSPAQPSPPSPIARLHMDDGLVACLLQCILPDCEVEGLGGRRVLHRLLVVAPGDVQLDHSLAGPCSNDVNVAPNVRQLRGRDRGGG